MDKNNFKIGDEVRFCDPSRHKIGNTTGIVVEVNRRIRVKWDTDKCVICGDNCCGVRINIWSYYPEEIEHVLRKGEQLMFKFMEV